MTTANAPITKSRHDTIYTVLLAVLAFFI